MTASAVPRGAKQGAETRSEFGHKAGDKAWVEASIWTERMVSALVNGVEACPERSRRGGQWYSLMDKVYAPKTLALAWARVRANQGVAGVDGQSVERFEAKAEANCPKRCGKAAAKRKD